MNQQKRQVVFKKVKDYVKHRKKELRFPFHPSFERSADLRNDLRNLEEYHYDLGKVRQSDIWCQRYDKEKPLKIETLKASELWDFLYSDKWRNSSSIRVCEGALLDFLLESLYFLQRSGALKMYRMARFDECQFLCPHTANKLVNFEFPSYKSQPVKITFTFFGIGTRHWVAEDQPSNQSLSSGSPLPFHVIACSDNEESMSSVEVGFYSDSTTTSSEKSNICARMLRCLSDTGSPSVLLDSNRLVNLSVQSDPSVSRMPSVITPLQAFRNRVNYQTNKKGSTVKTSTSGMKKGSIQFKPSHESMENCEIVFEDDRYCKEEGDHRTKLIPDYFLPYSEMHSGMSCRTIDPREHIAEPDLKQAFAILKDELNFGVTRRREVLLTTNTSDGKSMYSMARSPAKRRVMRTEERAGQPPKMHPDRGALAYRPCGYKSPITARDAEVYEEDLLKLLSSENEDDFSSVREITPPAVNESMTQWTGVKEKVKILPGNKASVKAVKLNEKEPKTIDVYSLNMSHSIEQLRLKSIRRKRTTKPLKPAELLKRKYITSVLESQLQQIYEKKNLTKKPPEGHPIHLFSNDPYITEKIRIAEEYKRTSEVKAETDEPLFPQLDADAFQRILLQAAKDFLIRKEQVTCACSLQTITSVTFNRISPCRYGQE